MKKRVLFICSQNRLRSPTAERIFSDSKILDVRSAGLDHDAEETCTPELVKWAEIIFLMERSHRNRLRKKFRPYIDKQRLICLEIPDVYAFMDPELVKLLKTRVGFHV